METITLKFTPTIYDYASVNRRLVLNSFSWSGKSIVWKILMSIMGFMLIVTMIGKGPGVLINILPTVVLIGILFWLGPLIGAQFYRKVVSMAGEVTFELTDDHVLVKDGTGEYKQPWSTYKKVIVTKNYYILTLALTSGAGRFIHRRAFETPEQENAFRELLVRKLNFKG